MDGGHVERDERATLGRAGKRIGGDTEPAGVVAAGVVGPELLLGVEADALLQQCAALEFVAAHRSFSMRTASA